MIAIVNLVFVLLTGGFFITRTEHRQPRHQKRTMLDCGGRRYPTRASLLRVTILFAVSCCALLASQTFLSSSFSIRSRMNVDTTVHRRSTVRWYDCWLVRLAAEITYGLYPEEFPAPTVAPHPTEPPTAIYWDFVGTDVVGPLPEEGLGSAALWLDGTGDTMMLAGATGSVRYYRLRVEFGHRKWSWVQDLLPPREKETRVSVSLTTSLVMVGEPELDRVSLLTLDNNDDVWLVVDVLTGKTGDQFGRTVDASWTGNRFVVGAPNTDYLEIYDYNLDESVSPTLLLRIDAFGTVHDNIGASVRISGDGRVVAAGAYRSDVDRGCVLIYNLRNVDDGDPYPSQELVGNALGAGDDVFYHNSTNSGRSFGHALAFSDDASILVIGTSEDDYVQVLSFQKDEGTYSKITHNLVGDTGSRFGSSLSLNGSGTRILIGAPGMGAARVYALRRETGSVFSLGYLTPKIFDDWTEFGTAVSMAKDGSRVAVAGYPNGPGLVHVYGVLSFLGDPYATDPTDTERPTERPSVLPSSIGSQPTSAPTIAPVVTTESPTRDPASFDWTNVNLGQIFYYVLVVLGGGVVTGISTAALVTLVVLAMVAVILLFGAPFILLFQNFSVVPTDLIT